MSKRDKPAKPGPAKGSKKPIKIKLVPEFDVAVDMAGITKTELRSKNRVKVKPINKIEAITRPKVVVTKRTKTAQRIMKSEYDRVIDWNVAKDMVRVGCNIDECAGRFGVTRTIMRERCVIEQGMYWDEFEQSGFMTTLHRLRDIQFKIALGYNRTGSDGKLYPVAPDTTMAIHLGKQYLGQSEKLDIKTLFTGYIIENENGEVVDGDYEEQDKGIIDGRAVINLDDYENSDDAESN